MNRGLVYFRLDLHHWVRDYVAAAFSSPRLHANHILLISNSPISEANRTCLATYCDEILPRPNERLDASVYRADLEHLDWERPVDFDELILTNYTYYTPPRLWGEVLTRATGWGDISFWGMTEYATIHPHLFLAQRELPRHLQSHWITMRRRLLTDLAFQECWEQVPPVFSYHDFIQWHESRFTGHFTELGHTWRVAFPVDRYRSENPAIEGALALLTDGCPLLKRRALFHDPLHQDRQTVIDGELLEAAVQAGYSEDLILSNVIHTAAARDLIVNAGLTEAVTGCVPGTAGTGAETSSPERRPTGYVVAHAPAGGEVFECAEVDRLVQRLASLSAHWRVVVTSPERLDTADPKRITDRHPSQKGTQEDSVHGKGDVSFRLARDLNLRGTIALFIQRNDLWDSGRAVGGGGGGNSDPLVLRITVGPPPVPGTRVDDVVHWQVLNYPLNSPGYTAGLIDLFAHHPGLGVAMSATGHIGQAHGGSTRDGLVGVARALSRQLGLSAELDPFASMVPPGATFMTRPEALHALSEGTKESVWLTNQAAVGIEQSAERLKRAHVAEVLELLTVYTAMFSGLRPREVLTPVWAGWLYGVLAYKHQIVTADLLIHIDEQVRFLRVRLRLLIRISARVHAYVGVHHPNMGGILKPTYRYLTSGVSGLACAATSAGKRLRDVGRHREEDKGD